MEHCLLQLHQKDLFTVLTSIEKVNLLKKLKLELVKSAPYRRSTLMNRQLTLVLKRARQNTSVTVTLGLVLGMGKANSASPHL
jgi:hypothetical protein